MTFPYFLQQCPDCLPLFNLECNPLHTHHWTLFNTFSLKLSVNQKYWTCYQCIWWYKLVALRMSLLLVTLKNARVSVPLLVDCTSSVQHIDTGRTEKTGNKNKQVDHNRSCGKRKSCNRFVRCQNLRPRKSSEDTTAQRVYPHRQGDQLYEQKWGSLQPTYDLWPYFGHVFISASRDHIPDEVRCGKTKLHN